MSNNFIESLHVKDVRKFQSIELKFNKGFNFIAGPNGCGKTSVLVCLAHCFDPSGMSYSSANSESELWCDITVKGEKFRVGQGQGSFDSQGYRRSGLVRGGGVLVEDGRTNILTYLFKEQANGFYPLFIGARRSISYREIGGMTKEVQSVDAANVYISNNVRSLYGDWTSDIKQWLVNRYFIIDKDWAGVERDNFQHLIKSLPMIGPFDSQFSFVEIHRDLEPIFSIYNKRCYLEELSSGFQAVLTIIATIFEWVEQGGAGSRLVMEAAGTVLIDELDLHLHPEWQFTLRDSLMGIFPNLQFIVTTHSPHLLASAGKNEILILPAESGVFSISGVDKAFSGWTTDQILSEVMGVVSLDNKDYERLTSNALEQIEIGSIAGLQNAINELANICHPSDTIVTVLKAKLAGMVALKND